MTQETMRLRQPGSPDAPWRLWGPYLSQEFSLDSPFHTTGRGLGASHQTGWTGLVTKLICPRLGSHLESKKEKSLANTKDNISEPLVAHLSGTQVNSRSKGTRDRR